MSLDPLTSIFDLGKSVVERIWPDANKRAEEMRKLEELKQGGELAKLDAHVKLLVGQLEINKVEAASKSLFVAGWRPFIGWICGLGLAYNVILSPFLDIWFDIPKVDVSALYPVLMGMLGIGGMRTVEKIKGVAREK